ARRPALPAHRRRSDLPRHPQLSARPSAGTARRPGLSLDALREAALAAAAAPPLRPRIGFAIGGRLVGSLEPEDARLLARTVPGLVLDDRAALSIGPGPGRGSADGEAGATD